MRRAGALVALLCLLLAGCTAPPPPVQPPPPVERPEPGPNPIVRFSTDRGDFDIEVFEEMVPVTAGNFLDYARGRFYEGVKVHRALKNFAIQMGDPNTRDLTKSRETWGTGDPSLRRIPDEFHAGLRHGAAGVVSMANTGPETGTSQFFITVTALKPLDDKHAVFGRVVHGMDVVKAISEVPTTTHGTARNVPVEDITIRRTEVLEARRDPAAARHGLEVSAYTRALNTSANHTVQFAVLVRNTGEVRETFQVEVGVPEGWRSNVPCPSERRRTDCPVDRTVGAGDAQFVLVQVRAPATEPFGARDVVVRVASPNASAAVNLTLRVGTLGERPTPGDTVRMDYVGYLKDGRVFDSSRWDVIRDPAVPKLDLGTPRSEDPRTYVPLEFLVGPQDCSAPNARCVVPGFDRSTQDMRLGEAGTALLPPHLAYGPTFDTHKLAGRWLLFDMELLSITEG